MARRPGDASEYVPASTALRTLAAAARGCRGCDLHRDATQTVFGSGPRRAALVLVGEQPGDVEDRRGRVFVGPAGRLLRTAMAEAGLADEAVYLTNAVKHFRWKYTPSGGKRRIHERPSGAQINACRPWLAAELHAVRPRIVLALGAVAAQSLFGSAFRLTRHRGELLSWPPDAGAFATDRTPILGAMATIHPSAVLRADEADRADRYRGLVDDLAGAKAAAEPG
jgi:DNA polymerase